MADFQVGDLVIAPRRWKGELSITDIIKERTYPIRVFNKETGKEYIFCLDGKEHFSDLEPSLYHAGTKITIEEAKPVRWPWVNVYNSESGVWIRDVFKTFDEAYNTGSKELWYSHTIQLKPEQ